MLLIILVGIVESQKTKDTAMPNKSNEIPAAIKFAVKFTLYKLTVERYNDSDSAK